jgi:AbrB family looped-hinge helix DNA binding protein
VNRSAYITANSFIAPFHSARFASEISTPCRTCMSTASARLPASLRLCKNRFNREVRPWVTEIRIGTQGVAFDRLELDSWADEHKSRRQMDQGTTVLRKHWREQAGALRSVPRTSSSTLTSNGRTTIPKEIRDRFGMKTGDRMTFALRWDGSVLIKLRTGPTCPG